MEYSERPLPPQRNDDITQPAPSRRPLADRDIESGKDLGSLAQSARGKKLNQARGILFFVGVLTIGVNIWGYFQIQNEVNAVRQRGLIVDQSLVQLLYAATYVAIALGGIFVLFGFLVKQYPVPITITSLVLYIVANLAFGILNPANLAAGAIVKIVIIVCLAQSIQAAFAYQKQEYETERAREYGAANDW